MPHSTRPTPYLYTITRCDHSQRDVPRGEITSAAVWRRSETETQHTQWLLEYMRFTCGYQPDEFASRARSSEVSGGEPRTSDEAEAAFSDSVDQAAPPGAKATAGL